jgi:Nitroreductase
MSATPRIADYAINEQFINRWSPRAFTAEPISEETLLSFLEAARWAPSAYNSQPWRFLMPRRDTPSWERYLSLLVPFNRSWAQQASALVLIISKTTFAAPGSTEEKPALWHTFDTGPPGATWRCRPASAAGTPTAWPGSTRHWRARS